MSTYCDLPIAPILEAVEKWKQRCVIEQLSLFGDGRIWNTRNLDEIRKNFIERPDLGAGNFLAKLKAQLGDTPPEVSQLAAELAWLMYLFPYGSMGPKVKLDNLNAIWKMSGVDLPQPHWALKPEVLSGIGSTGTFYNTGFWVEFSYAVLVFLRLFALDTDARTALTKPDADFSGWLDGLTLIERLPGGPPLNPGKRQFRHIMLFLFQPDRYERISSTQQKRDIVKRLGPQVGLQPDLSTPSAVDRQLFEIRQALEQRHGTKEIDFYRPPVKQLWQDSTPPENQGVKEPKKIYVTDPVANYWLTGAYWDGGDVSETFVREGRWENGYTDRLLEQVKAVQVGDRIAMKSTYVQKNDLPFDNRGKLVSCMAIKARGVVTENAGDGRNLKVDWEPRFKPFVIYHYTYRPTISRIDAQKYPQVMKWIFNDEKQPIDAAQISGLTDTDDAGLIERFGVAPRNVVFYGPPGTGKTWTLIEEVLPAYIDDPEVESDAARLERAASGLGWFELIAAVVLEAGGKPIRVRQICDHRFVAAKLASGATPKHLNALMWGMLQLHTVRESRTVNTNVEKRIEPLVFDKNEQSEWYLAPNWQVIAPELEGVLETLRGKGESKAMQIERYEMVTFHPSFAYEDFVEGLRPVEVEREDGSTFIEIRPVSGALKRLCERARRDPESRYALVIDEINRGNVAKIFGELITLVEPDKRLRYDEQGRRTGGIEVRLPYTGEAFGVPENVDLYGTMNTSDRSIALVDIALRRRFIFRELMPLPGVIEGADGEGRIEPDDDGDFIDLRRLLSVINARLTVLRGRDACIGHAYLTLVTDLDALRSVFRDRLIPLLQEYFYEDWAGIAQVLSGPNGKSAFVYPIQPNLTALFGSQDVADRGFAERMLYRVIDIEKLTAADFRGLYEGVSAAALDIF